MPEIDHGDAIMNHENIGNIFTDDENGRHVVGFLCHDRNTLHSLVGVYPSEMVEVAKTSAATVINAACLPFASVFAPYIDPTDICLKQGKKRIKLGYIYTQDDATGRVIYQVRFIVETVLRQWERVFLHVGDVEKNAGLDGRRERKV